MTRCLLIGLLGLVLSGCAGVHEPVRSTNPLTIQPRAVWGYFEPALVFVTYADGRTMIKNLHPYEVAER